MNYMKSKKLSRIAWVITLSTSTLISVAAEKKIQELPSVTVKAIPRDIFDTTTAETPSLDIATTTIGPVEIERQNAKTVTDALMYTPGALTETRGRKVKEFVSFRGQRYPYPDYAINGIWQREFHELPYLFPASQIERIEVIRSSAGLLMGMSSIAGVINIIPKSFTEPATYSELEYGTYNTINGHLFHADQFKDGGYTIGLGYQTTDGPDNMNAKERMSSILGTMDWNATEELSFRLNLSGLYGSRQLRRATTPAANRFLTTDEEFDPFQAVMLTLRTHYQKSDTAATELLLYTTDREHEFSATTAGNHTTTDERDYEYGVQLMQALTLCKDNILRFGTLYNHWVAPDGKRFYNGHRTDLHTFSAVIVDEHTIGRTAVNAGLRYNQTYMKEYGAFNIKGSGKKFKSVDPVEDEWDKPILDASTGLKYDLDEEISLYLNGAGGIIQPRTGTLNTNLDKPDNEIRTMVDTGIRFNLQEIGQISLGAFCVDRQNALILSGKTEFATNGREFELYDNSDMRQYGLEFDAQSVPLENILTLFVNATIMDSDVKKSGHYKSDVTLPDVIVGVGANATIKRLDASILLKYVSEYENNRFAGDGQYHPLGDFINIDLTAGYRFGVDKNTRLYAAIKNVTNDKYSTVVGYPDYGIRCYGGIQHTF